MNLLDENIRDDQRMLLRRWRIPFRQVGKEISRAGTHDDNLLSLLDRLKRSTLFTQDEGWFNMVVTRFSTPPWSLREQESGLMSLHNWAHGNKTAAADLRRLRSDKA